MLDDEELLSSFSKLEIRSKSIDYDEYPARFVKEVFSIWQGSSIYSSVDGLPLAALFDLAVTAVYLEKVPTSNWYYCPLHGRAFLVYPFVNACPTCILEGEFNYVEAKKPSSAQIGAATSNIIASFLDLRAKAIKGDLYEVKTLNDNGMVDAYLTGPNLLALFEIKSAPLIAFPLMCPTFDLTTLDEEMDELVALQPHTYANVSENQEAFLILDKFSRIPVGDVQRFPKQNHYQRILDWLSENDNLSTFIKSWRDIYLRYKGELPRNEMYWMTNGCGKPSPTPTGWPRRKTSGFQSISDGKSSVGMDRTDDLKKGIYQVLKISTHYKEFFPNNEVEVCAALISNIHAIKHREGYLSELEDIVWTIDGKNKSYVQVDKDGNYLVESGKLYNLFDAIITFTESHFRSTVLKEIYGYND